MRVECTVNMALLFVVVATSDACGAVGDTFDFSQYIARVRCSYRRSRTLFSGEVLCFACSY